MNNTFQWEYKNTITLREIHSGFELLLLSGTWKHPVEIKPRTPKLVSAVKEAKLIRMAMEFSQSRSPEQGFSRASNLVVKNAV